MSIFQVFHSSIGKKIIMGLTGFFLISFLVIHATVNGMIFFNDYGKMYNEWAHFMSHNWIVRILEIGLFVGFIIHIYQGFALTLSNNKARTHKYAVAAGNATSKWYSRSMAILGSLLLIFLVVHLSQFWWGTKVQLYANGDPEHNLFEEMRNAFKYEWNIAIYLIGVFSLGWHLLHGFPSAFQTLGLNNSKYNKLIKNAGIAFSIFIPLIFALMPIAFYFNWLK